MDFASSTYIASSRSTPTGLPSTADVLTAKTIAPASHGNTLASARPAVRAVGARGAVATAPVTMLRGLDAVARELPVERGGIDAEDFGGARLVAAFGLQHPEA